MLSLGLIILYFWSTFSDRISAVQETEVALDLGALLYKRALNESGFERTQLTAAQTITFGPSGRQPDRRESPRYCPQIFRQGFTPFPATEVPAIPNDSELIYLTPVTVGGQSLMLQLDTGSADLYVLGSQVPSEKRHGRTVFNPDPRRFRIVPGINFKLEYVNGDTATGYVGTSTVNLGGVVLERQTINVATDVGFESSMDGLIGLSAGKGINGKLPRQNGFLECFMRSMELPLFAVSFRPGRPSSFQIGRIDETKFRSRLTAVQVDPVDGQWQFYPVGTRVGTFVANRQSPSLVDTGSSLLGMDEDVVTAYYKQVQGAQYSKQAGGYYFPCKTPLLDVEIFITDQYHAVVPASLIRGPRLTSNTNLATPTDETYCLGTLQTKVDKAQSFGVVFLKSQYTIFDRGNLALAFAPHAL